MVSVFNWKPSDVSMVSSLGNEAGMPSTCRNTVSMEVNFVLRLLKAPLEAGQGTQKETGYAGLN